MFGARIVTRFVLNEMAEQRIFKSGMRNIEFKSQQVQVKHCVITNRLLHLCLFL